MRGSWEWVLWVFGQEVSASHMEEAGRTCFQGEGAGPGDGLEKGGKEERRIEDDCAASGPGNWRDSGAMLGEVKAGGGAGLSVLWSSRVDTLRHPRGAVRGLAVGMYRFGVQGASHS